jgi:hypothetical protein
MDQDPGGQPHPEGRAALGLGLPRAALVLAGGGQGASPNNS